MKQFMSKEQLIEDQASLNLSLMKWRLEPQLDLDKIKGTRVLLLGSGTLGCNMGRLLVGYGVRNLTFVDSGSVSYSNLARQNLFDLGQIDEHGKGMNKAEAVKQSIEKIAPYCKVQDINMRIPMPGHFVNSDNVENVFCDLNKLEELVRENDIILNLFDSREARYFPTLFGSIYNKNVMSIGLGYDSFVIVQHGNYGFEESLQFFEGSQQQDTNQLQTYDQQNENKKKEDQDQQQSKFEKLQEKVEKLKVGQNKLDIQKQFNQKEIDKIQSNGHNFKKNQENQKTPEQKESDKNFNNNQRKEKICKDNKSTNYGCFFCTDYLPPMDSISNRSIDQQCTVSRLGISMVASGIGAEILINNLHQGKIGEVRHFVRGTVGSQFEICKFENSRFLNCVACSKGIIQEFLKGRRKFLVECMNNSKSICKYTGFDVECQDYEECNLEDIIIINDKEFEEMKQSDEKK